MEQFRYELKSSLLTDCEKQYFFVIKGCLPEGYSLVPQVNLATIIRKLGDFKYQNELYRNVDGCIFNAEYRPIAVIEINDNSHNDYKRKQRDAKVKEICEEAGIQIVTFWTSYGVNPQYIAKRIAEAIEKAPYVERIAHTRVPEETDAVEPYRPSEERTDSSAAYFDDLNYTQSRLNNTYTPRRFEDGYNKPIDPERAKLFKMLNWIFYGGLVFLIILVAIFRNSRMALEVAIVCGFIALGKIIVSKLILDKKIRGVMWQQAKTPIIAILLIFLLAVLYGLGVSLGWIDPPKSLQERNEERMKEIKKNKQSVCRVLSEADIS